MNSAVQEAIWMREVRNLRCYKTVFKLDMHQFMTFSAWGGCEFQRKMLLIIA